MISLTSVGTVGTKIRALGIPVRTLGIAPFPAEFDSLFRLAKWLRQGQRPSIVQTWMYHADLIGGIAARLAGGDVPVVWGLHNSTLDRKTSKWTTRLVVRILALLAAIAPRLRTISALKAARQLHVRSGLPG